MLEIFNRVTHLYLFDYPKLLDIVLSKDKKIYFNLPVIKNLVHKQIDALIEKLHINNINNFLIDNIYLTIKNLCEHCSKNKLKVTFTKSIISSKLNIENYKTLKNIINNVENINIEALNPLK